MTQCSVPKKDASTYASSGKTKETIDAKMTIGEILSSFPERSHQLAHLLSKAGLNCVGCHAATWETLEGGVLGHGKDQAALEKLVNDLNDVLQKPLQRTSVTLTERAAQRFLAIAQEEGRGEVCLRFGDRAGGCSGYEYILDFCDGPEEGDASFISHGVTVIVSPSSLGRLLGCEIDYIDGLHGAGFKISNPNSRASCGCGHSHNY